MRVIDHLTGDVFGRLTVLHRAPRHVRFETRAAWVCRCECGRQTTVIGRSLRNGMTNSCGCLRDESARDRHLTHGQYGTREHRSWCAAKTRCFNPRIRSFKDYGGRGITMCDRWRDSFEAFRADMGPCPKGHSIERLDTNGHYEPGNCVWASALVQANNHRNNHFVEYMGRRQTVAQWERTIGFKSGTLKRRLLNGWPIERAMTEPLRIR